MKTFYLGIGRVNGGKLDIVIASVQGSQKVDPLHTIHPNGIVEWSEAPGIIDETEMPEVVSILVENVLPRERRVWFTT